MRMPEGLQLRSSYMHVAFAEHGDPFVVTGFIQPDEIVAASAWLFAVAIWLENHTVKSSPKEE